MPLPGHRLPLSRRARSRFLERSRLSVQLLQNACRCDDVGPAGQPRIRGGAPILAEQISLCPANRGFPGLRPMRRLHRSDDPGCTRALRHHQCARTQPNSGGGRDACRDRIRCRVARAAHCAPRTTLVAGHRDRHLTIRLSGPRRRGAVLSRATRRRHLLEHRNAEDLHGQLSLRSGDVRSRPGPVAEHLPLQLFHLQEDALLARRCQPRWFQATDRRRPAYAVCVQLHEESPLLLQNLRRPPVRRRQ